MKGADEYANLFSTGQHGRLYLVSSSHARGKTFRIFVLPEGEDAKPNGDCNGPRNKDAIEVFGAVSGNLGWTESYGWIFKGPWVEDFENIVQERKDQLAKQKAACEEKAEAEAEAEQSRQQALLSTYPGSA